MKISDDAVRLGRVAMCTRTVLQRRRRETYVGRQGDGRGTHLAERR